MIIIMTFFTWKMTLRNFFIFFIIFLDYCKGQQKCPEQLDWIVRPNMKLYGYNDMTMSEIHSASQCRSLCLWVTHLYCRSIEYKFSARLCVLSTSRAMSGTALTYSPGYEYHEWGCVSGSASGYPSKTTSYGGLPGSTPRPYYPTGSTRYSAIWGYSTSSYRASKRITGSTRGFTIWTMTPRPSSIFSTRPTRETTTRFTKKTTKAPITKKTTPTTIKTTPTSKKTKPTSTKTTPKTTPTTKTSTKKPAVTKPRTTTTSTATSPATTTEKPTTSTINPGNFPMHITFSFLENYEDVIGYDEDVFVEELQAIFATIHNVTASRIYNLDLSDGDGGVIVVDYDLLPSDSDDRTMMFVVNKMKKAVEGNFSIEGPASLVLRTNHKSFEFYKTTKAPVTDHGVFAFKPVYVALIGMGLVIVLLFIVAILIIVLQPVKRRRLTENTYKDSIDDYQELPDEKPPAYMGTENSSMQMEPEDKEY